MPTLEQLEARLAQLERQLQERPKDWDWISYRDLLSKPGFSRNRVDRCIAGEWIEGIHWRWESVGKRAFNWVAIQHHYNVGRMDLHLNWLKSQKDYKAILKLQGVV